MGAASQPEVDLPLSASEWHTYQDHIPPLLKSIEVQGGTMQGRFFDYLIRYGAAAPMTTPLNDCAQQPLLVPRILPTVSDAKSEEFVLSDNRKLGVAYFGAATGAPVFYLHGYPGCRLSGAFFDAPGKKLGARIIAVDRPGIGNSSPQPGRVLLDLANDVRELAEQLNFRSYGIIGVSGGGPYALACAHSLPVENLKGVSIIGGMGPIELGTKGMSWGNWFTFTGLIYFPFIIRWLQNKVVRLLDKMTNEKLVEAVQGKLSDKSASWLGSDLMILKDPESFSTMLDLYREHFKQGVDGYMEDGYVLTRDWGFRLEDIPASIPIQLWYSRKDINVPLHMGEAIAARLRYPPDFYVEEDETHLNLVLKYSADALERLLEKM
ncbi:hypothetical protein O9K51_11422 [Purpureocillium lavendulum]|uniref:AB hydrolase-1 domain-containing protein n=1 Tax=Purpureocillium lavendulum TaxID=1247861 RepID=A0AB34FB49_9HYPO|nr:hypothetical protein O9K51_11422 [Purpureocillium lavendulum]